MFCGFYCPFVLFFFHSFSLVWFEEAAQQWAAIFFVRFRTLAVPLSYTFSVARMLFVASIVFIYRCLHALVYQLYFSCIREKNFFLETK